ncbi:MULTISPECIES: hypothetical protein [unclassified Caballeronia]|uniref:hypothetical protein n=1 Tax=unclassified Caballeronia TaxID=2646786 RepID=UPI001FD14776|nr:MULTISPECIES: hypothetical protein [unclassified Caballeronia]MDR5772801.1 hypothetical protein [Caballeronia sp. LZ002]MDR5848235.1 hypothetical protein [Caballeronia sp. LZ003]
MKTRLVATALAASLLVAVGSASAQETYYRTAQVPGQTTADTSSQPAMQGSTQGQTGDMSYGGAPASRGATGAIGTTGTNAGISKPCVRGPPCDIFFGN